MYVDSFPKGNANFQLHVRTRDLCELVAKAALKQPALHQPALHLEAIKKQLLGSVLRSPRLVPDLYLFLI